MAVVVRSCVWLVVVQLGVLSAHAAEPWENTELNGFFRARYGQMDQQTNEGESFSALLRTSLNVTWQPGWSTFAELDVVGRALRDRHSDGVTENGRPLVPDTAGFDLNQLFLERDNGYSRWRLGRQRIEWDNQRFIGGNAFWQNEQTFDGLTAQFRFADSSLFQYAYVYNVNRIFGEQAGRYLDEDDPRFAAQNGLRPVSRLGDHALDAHWLRSEWNEWDYQHLTAYYYFTEYPDFAVLSHRQTGLRHTFDYKFTTWRLRTQLEYARQFDYETDNAASTSYQLLEAALGYHALEFAIRKEVLSARGGRAFITPLGSTHDFHGIIDKFVSTPENGLSELSLRISWRQAPWFIELRQFRFESEKQGMAFGNETDLSIRWRRHKSHSVLLSAGYFRAYAGSDYSDEWRGFLDYRYEF